MLKALLYSSLSLWLLLLSPISSAASSLEAAHIRVTLLSERDSLQPGQTHWVGILFEPEPHWHTYWRNPGDSGEAPNVTWQADADLQVGELQWPLPQQIPVAHLVNYGYEGSVLLMAALSLPNDLTQASITLNADLSWLVCKEDCIPGWGTLNLTLPLSDAPQPSTAAARFQQTRQQLPAKQRLTAQHQVLGQQLQLSYQTPYPSDWQLLPLRSDTLEHSQPQQTHTQASDRYQTAATLSPYFADSNQPLGFLLSDGNQGYYLDSQPAALSAQSHLPSSQPPLLLLMLMAFAGGLLLNLMPCVLPVLSLKALSIQPSSPVMSKAVTSKAATSKAANQVGYPLGVLVSFSLFALLIIVLQQGGAAIGWGFHMQQPWVLVLLSFLFLFIAMQLMDIAPNGSRLMGIGQQLTQGEGFSSQFFTGVLAVLVASPCTAPFMATALGVALVSPPLVTLLLFISLGVGFALPMSLLFWSARFRHMLPKPGPWMQGFRQFLIFPMLATVVWLLWIYQQQSDPQALFLLLLSLLLFALLLWLSAQLNGRGSKLIWLLVALTIWLPMRPSQPPTEPALQTDAAFSEQKLQQLRDAGEVVLVNMTADWCITCKVNEQVAFRSERVQQLLGRDDIHYLVGDWTNKNQTILDYLKRYQRSGVPLYVVYAGHHYEQLLPQLLTPQTVIDAIHRAEKERQP